MLNNENNNRNLMNEFSKFVVEMLRETALRLRETDKAVGWRNADGHSAGRRYENFER